MCLQVADLIVPRTLLGFDATRQAFASALFAIGEAGAVGVAGTAIASVDTVASFADVSCRTRGFTVAAVARIRLSVDALDATDGQRCPTGDDSAIRHRGVGLRPAVGRSTVWHAGVGNWDPCIGGEDAGVVDRFQVFGGQRFINAGWGGTGHGSGTAAGFADRTRDPSAGTIENQAHEAGLAANETRLHAT